MAKWKKLNPATGEYEAIPNADTGSGGIVYKDSSLMSGARVVSDIASEAASVFESSKINADGAVQANNETDVYVLEPVRKGDVLIFCCPRYGSGILSDGSASLFSLLKYTFHDNYSWGEWTFTADKDYEKLYVSVSGPPEGKESNTWEHPVHLQWPSFAGQFVPVIADEERNNLKTLSSEKIRVDYGMDFLKAREALSGGVWIALGDSYTEYADSDFKALAAKYGMVYDGQGVVSSTVCGDDTGNKGYRPFHSRMDDFIEAYTGSGQTLDGVTYTADDVKLITFMGGANDGFGKDTWLGSHTSMDTNYIYGSCNYIFRKLRENFPNASIICILQPANFSDKMNYTEDEAKIIGFASLAEMQAWDIYSFGQYKMETKERAVKECAERFGIHIVDCIFDWYSVVNPTHRSTYWNTDAIHLSGAGTAALAEKLDRDGILKVFG